MGCHRVSARRGSGGFSEPRKIEPVPGGVQGQLYSLATDPREQFNVYNDHPEIVKRLTALLDQYKDSGHTLY
jgi:hypothetical protein